MADGRIPCVDRRITRSRSTRRLPPLYTPRLFARSIPSRCRSLMKRRSICATMPSTVKMTFPVSPFVETCGSRTVMYAPRCSHSWTMFRTSRVSRPRRSSRVTINSSSSRKNSMIVANSVRPRRLAPETFSHRTIWQPSATSRCC